MDRGDVKGFGTESVGEMDTNGRSANGEMDHLSQSGVGEIFRGQCVVRLGDLLGGSPGGDPVRRYCGARLRKCRGCERECGDNEEQL